MVGAAMVPETPSHLIEVGQEEKGREVLRKIRGVEGMFWLSSTLGKHVRAGVYRSTYSPA
jgi:hypothetical protein